jgi:hypothetical protein
MPRRRKRGRHGPNRRWRDYRTPGGARPVKDFIDRLNDADAAEVVAAMKEVEIHGLRAAKHLRGDIWEVVADGVRESFRILFVPEGAQASSSRAGGFSKKTRKRLRRRSDSPRHVFAHGVRVAVHSCCAISNMR